LLYLLPPANDKGIPDFESILIQSIDLLRKVSRPIEFQIRVAETIEEALPLMKAGFEYITVIEGKSIFRKRK
jgi:hypothetical protein